MPTKKTATKKETKKRAPVKKAAKKKPTKKRAAKKNNLIEVKSPVKKDSAFFVAAELADDKLIGQELLGQETKTLVYEYENEEGNFVHGLSYAGVREAVRIINRDKKSGHKIQISDRPPIIERQLQMNGQEGVEVQVYAQDIQAGGGSWGIKFEWWHRPTKDGNGGTEYNQFALETALSKAQRNAMFNLLPAHLIEDVIAKFVQDTEVVKKIEAPEDITRVVEPKKTPAAKLVEATFNRLEYIKTDKKQLKETLKKVEKMPLDAEGRTMIRDKINEYLEKL